MHNDRHLAFGPITSYLEVRSPAQSFPFLLLSVSSSLWAGPKPNAVSAPAPKGKMEWGIQIFGGWQLCSVPGISLSSLQTHLI